MARIDKLHIKSYHDLDELIRWALLYYPKLIAYFYPGILETSYYDFTRIIKTYAKIDKRQYATHWETVSSDGSIEAAKDYYAKKYDISLREAEEYAKEDYANFNKPLEVIMSEQSIPVMNTPFKVDRKLKWICPLPFIREYLISQCGMKEHWYYKLFWRGKNF